MRGHIGPLIPFGCSRAAGAAWSGKSADSKEKLINGASARGPAADTFALMELPGSAILDPEAVLEDLAVELGAAGTLGEVQAVTRSAPRRLVGARGATFVLRDGDRCFYADEDPVSPLWKGQRFPITECISGWSMLSGATAVIPDITRDERIPQEAYRPTFVRSLVMVPVGAPAFGAIGSYWGTVRRASAGEVATLEALAALVAAAVGRIGLDGAPQAPSFRHRAAARWPGPVAQ